MPDRAADSGLRCLGCDRSAATLSDLITYCPRARHENCPAAAARRSEVGDDFAGLAALALHKDAIRADMGCGCQAQGSEVVTVKRYGGA